MVFLVHSVKTYKLPLIRI